MRLSLSAEADRATVKIERDAETYGTGPIMLDVSAGTDFSGRPDRAFLRCSRADVRAVIAALESAYAMTRDEEPPPASLVADPAMTDTQR